MEEPAVTKKALAGTAVFAFFFLVAVTAVSLFSAKARMVFCDVGQGDAAYIRTRNGKDILIDAGPDDSVLTCLGKYMPYFDRQIEVAILSNADYDHFAGFLHILKRYRVKTIFLPPVRKKGKLFDAFIAGIEKNGSRVYFPLAGSTYELPEFRAVFYWPTSQYVRCHVDFGKGSGTSASSLLDSLGTSGADSNEFSLVFALKDKKNHKTLFTGDATNYSLEQIMLQREFVNERKFNTFKVPHHGSKNGFSYELIRLADPTLSVISVGRRNRFHHPSSEVLDALKALKKAYVRTDLAGDIVLDIN